MQHKRVGFMRCIHLARLNLIFDLLLTFVEDKADSICKLNELGCIKGFVMNGCLLTIGHDNEKEESRETDC